ncbi:MAG: glycosyltransferase family 4 protein [Bacteroidetes bacterium]|nr:glycosyltransferase family 4 protein [Bacteroidota bacterium]
MKILFLCNKSPWPAREGGPIAMNSLIEGLIEAGHQVKVLAVNSDKYKVDAQDIPEDYRSKTAIELEYIDLNIKPFDAFINLFTRKSYHVKRFISPAFRTRLISILSEQHFDVVQLETVFMAPYVSDIRKYSKAVVVLRAHNVEHLIWKRLSVKTRNPLRRFYLRHLSRTLEQYEISVLDQFDGIAAITRKDASFFRGLCTTPVIDIPFGLKPAAFDSGKDQPDWPGLFHIGSMNWMPNEEGIRWFLEKVWPLVQQAHPGLGVHLAGRYMPSWLVSGYRPNVHVVGEVESARAFILSKSVAVVPLLSGSGIRIKIIEAMALGRTVITTSIGAEGINYTDGKNILIADSPGNFARAISKCVDNKAFSLSVGASARLLIEESYDIRKITGRLAAFYQAVVPGVTDEKPHKVSKDL